MKREDRIDVSVSAFGSVKVSLFYYQNWSFFVGADYANDTNSVMNRIEKKYLDGVRTHKHLKKGFERHREELQAAIESELGGEEK